jgi:hypothetical protein
MELDAIEFAILIGNRSKWSPFGRCDDIKAGGQTIYAVSVAHPDLMTGAKRPNPIKQRALFLHGNEGAAIFAMIRAFNRTTQLQTHGLLAITDTENGDT